MVLPMLAYKSIPFLGLAGCILFKLPRRFPMPKCMQKVSYSGLSAAQHTAVKVSKLWSTSAIKGSSFLI